LVDGPGGAGGSTGRDWAAQITDRIDELIEKVRSQTTDRLVRVARLVVYGLVAAFMGVTALVLGVIGLIRLLDWAIPQEVWLTYLVVGAIFTIVGLFLWSRKSRPPSQGAA
jgi:hypothetical protein